MLLHFFLVQHGEANQTVAAFLRTKLNIPWSKAKKLIEQRQVRIAGQPTGDPAHRLKRGNRVEVHGHTPIVEGTSPRPEPPKPKTAQPLYTGPEPTLVYSDDWIVVVDKPAGLTTMRHREEAEEFGPRGKHYLPTTLADLLPKLLGQPRRSVRAVHRIDRDTSGLVIFARTQEAERSLMKQFREHTIDRRYLAAVRGTPKAGRIESHLVRDRGDGRRGSGEPGSGQRAVTHVRILESFDGFALVECRLETGRTHQVRIHLGEQGTPLCGESVYDRPLHGSRIPDASGARRPMLHAAHLGVHHPESDEWMEWEVAPPADMAKLIIRLREPE